MKRIIILILWLWVSLPAGGEADTVRVMIYNIHHGQGLDGRLDPGRIAALINTWTPDLVGLNEVDRGVERSLGLDLADTLASLTGLEYVFGRSLVFDGGEYGNAILTRRPPVARDLHYLPCLDGGEQRSVLEVTVRVDSGPLRFLVTHLDHREPERERLDSAELLNTLVTDPAPVILAGDLNAVPGSATLERFLEVWSLSPRAAGQGTYPASGPRKQIDYVLTWPRDRFEVLEYRVIADTLASDHRPVVVDIVIRP